MTIKNNLSINTIPENLVSKQKLIDLRPLALKLANQVVKKRAEVFLKMLAQECRADFLKETQGI